ncbi:putative RNA-directed DNA polymerase [Dioscorea sansibarensis]
MDPNVRLGDKKTSIPVDRGRFQRLIGKLIYLSHTRPDIGFAVSCISQFMHAPMKEHMAAANRVLRCLKETLGRGLFFKKTTNCGIETFTDADWAGSIVDRRSTSGYCTFV